MTHGELFASAAEGAKAAAEEASPCSLSFGATPDHLSPGVCSARLLHLTIDDWNGVPAWMMQRWYDVGRVPAGNYWPNVCRSSAKMSRPIFVLMLKIVESSGRGSSKESVHRT
jgi:hypothetical protein